MTTNYTFIDTQSSLVEMSSALAREKVIAFDIECSSNLHHYVNRVCLMQFAANGKVFLVDVQKELDLSPIKRILEDPSIEIVMHDTSFDLISLDRHYGWRPKNLFDTMIAARLCGEKAFGLATLLEKHFGIKGSKKFQRADWTVRPLSKEMLDYAGADVVCLEELRDLQARELERLGRMEWARKKFKLCEDKRYEQDDRPPFAKIKNARLIRSGQDLAVLNELAIARDNIARELDLPHFMVISDPVLLSLAKEKPRNARAISRLKGLHPKCKGMFAQVIVSAIEKGLRAPPLGFPRQVWHKGEGYDPQLFDRLRAWRIDFANKAGLDPDLIISMGGLKKLASGAKLDEVLLLEQVDEKLAKAIKEGLCKDTDITT